MQQKLIKLYYECVKELEKIGIKITNNPEIGEIQISLSKRNNKRYGVCRQENPDLRTRYIEKKGRHKIIKYSKYKNHYVEISPWVMQLDEKIIRNTIIHELIHCMPYCNNHGKKFKEYAETINKKLGYNISRVGNKKEDYKTSNIEYKENEKFKYKIQCKNCGQTFYRQRYNKNFIKKYRCGKCLGKLIISEI